MKGTVQLFNRVLRALVRARPRQTLSNIRNRRWLRRYSRDARLTRPTSYGINDVVVISTVEQGLAPSKLDPSRYFPPFARALKASGLRLHFAIDASLISEIVLSSHQSNFIFLYDEELQKPPALERAEEVINERVTVPIIFNEPSRSAYVGDKRETHRLLTSEGVAMPELVLSDQSDVQRIFSIPAYGAQLPAFITSNTKLDASRHNTRFIDTAFIHRGRTYYVSLRAMCIWRYCFTILVRAKEARENNPSVHSLDTPRDADLLNAIYAQVVIPRLAKILDICERAGIGLGYGFYAHDLLPEANSNNVYLCESGIKFWNPKYAARMAPIARLLQFNTMSAPNEIESAGLVFVQVLKEVRRMSLTGSNEKHRDRSHRISSVSSTGAESAKQE